MDDLRVTLRFVAAVLVRRAQRVMYYSVILIFLLSEGFLHIKCIFSLHC